MSADVVLHQLAFAVRVEDHFSAELVPDPLDVRIDTGEPPVAPREGGTRHGDGTYRWADLADGLRKLSVRSETARWVRWDASPIDVVVPVAAPGAAIRVEMWPTPLATPAPGVPAIRGKLVGAAVGGLRVEIDGTGVTTPSGRWTLADAAGELLFPLPGGPWPTTADGLLDLTVVVPGRTVTAIDVLPGPVSSSGDRLVIAADRISRVRIHVS